MLRAKHDSDAFRALILLDWESRELRALSRQYTDVVNELREAVIALADAMEP